MFLKKKSDRQEHHLCELRDDLNSVFIPLFEKAKDVIEARYELN